MFHHQQPGCRLVVAAEVEVAIEVEENIDVEVEVADSRNPYG